MCDISVCCRLSRLKVKEAFRTFRDWLAVQLHIPASTFCHCCLNTATVESFPMSLACGPKGHFGKCNSYEDIKSHKNSYKFTIFYSCVRAIQVLWAEQQVVKKRKKRDVYEDPTDPDFHKQWYLVCNRFCNFILFCFSFSHTFEACSYIYLGASRKIHTFFIAFYWTTWFQLSFQCPSTSCLTAECSDSRCIHCQGEVIVID